MGWQVVLRAVEYRQLTTHMSEPSLLSLLLLHLHCGTAAAIAAAAAAAAALDGVDQSAFDAYAMGNYHFASDYMTGHAGYNLPAWPMRAACQEMTNRPAPSAAQPASQTAETPAPTSAAAAAAAGSVAASRRLLKQQEPARQQHAASADIEHHSAHAYGGVGKAQRGDVAPDNADKAEQSLELLVKLRKAAGLMYNVTGDATCFTLDMSGPGAASVGEWQWQPVHNCSCCALSPTDPQEARRICCVLFASACILNPACYLLATCHVFVIMISTQTA
jgi:pyruvate/2-oxoglutarate dehydrogenase complex dihydrolipoamide acyltransferase (E2) component